MSSRRPPGGEPSRARRLLDLGVVAGGDDQIFDGDRALKKAKDRAAKIADLLSRAYVAGKLPPKSHLAGHFVAKDPSGAWQQLQARVAAAAAARAESVL